MRSHRSFTTEGSESTECIRRVGAADSPDDPASETLQQFLPEREVFNLGDGTGPYDKVGRAFEDWANQGWDVPSVFQTRQKGAGKSLMGALDDVVNASFSGHPYSCINAAVIDDQPFYLVDSWQALGKLSEGYPESVFLIEAGDLNNQLGN